jgi:preprotein translocase subunit SecF
MKSRDDFGNVINRSINEVLSRTIVTGISTLIALGAIMALGGEVLFDFAFALFIGLIVGTYSSIFVASPIVYAWRKKGL